MTGGSRSVKIVTKKTSEGGIIAPIVTAGFQSLARDSLNLGNLNNSGGNARKLILHSASVEIAAKERIGRDAEWQGTGPHYLTFPLV